MAKSKQSATVTTIDVPPIQVSRAKLTLVGDTSLIVHRWSDKAKKQMLDKQMKKATGKKEAKDPEADYQSSLYRMSPNGHAKKKGKSKAKQNGNEYGFPAVAFKTAAVSACRYVDDMAMTVARGAFHVRAQSEDGELVGINGEPRMHEDMVRLSGRNGVADIRYRGEFPVWSVDLEVDYNEGVLSIEQLVNLFNIAGFSIGVGEKRPERGHSNGRFHVALEGES